MGCSFNNSSGVYINMTDNRIPGFERPLEDRITKLENQIIVTHVGIIIAIIVAFVSWI